MLSEEMNAALDEFKKYKVFAVRSLHTRLDVEHVFIDDFDVVRPAFDSTGRLGGLTEGTQYTLIPLDEAVLPNALRNIRHALGGLEEPSYTLHTFNARIDHIIDCVRSLFKTKELISITKLEELQWIVYPFSRKSVGGEFTRIDYSLLGNMQDFVMDMEGASKIEATGLGSDE